jgi:glycosyltransferase involved in cell wall biosynthesis
MYLTWISSDNRQFPNFLQRLIECITSATPNTVLVYSLFWPIDDKGVRFIPDDLWFPSISLIMNRPKEEIMITCFIGASFLFTRSAYEQAGGYDPKYGVISDYEFWIRLMPCGEFLFIQETLMDYRLKGKYSLTTLTPPEELYLQSMAASIDHRRQNGDIPKVTVIITTHNHEHYIQTCIQSVLAQTYSEFHLLVIDVGSVDTTLSKIYAIHDTRMIPIHISLRNKAEAMNIGLKYVLGEYVLELDGDDWLDPLTLEIMIREMDAQTSEVGMVYANRKLWFEEGGQLIEGPIYSGISYKDKYEVLCKMQTHCPRMYRHSVLEDLNGWITSLHGEPLLADDYMMFLKIAERYKIHWIDVTLYHQRRHSTNITIVDKEKLNRHFKMVVVEMLLQWGNIYIPEFEEIDGYITKITLL